MAPKEVTTIGVFGTGVMAKMQVQYLQSITDCKRIIVWGRSEASLQSYKDYMQDDGYDVRTTLESEAVTDVSNLILMTTPSATPLINADQIKSGVHITAMGSDTAEKQELDAEILCAADVVVADSLVQCTERGEIYKALSTSEFNLDQVVELGSAIANGKRIRTSDEQVTVADLTGVAVQDVQIAKAVSAALGEAFPETEK